jgi:hypothetical protein
MEDTEHYRHRRFIEKTSQLFSKAVSEARKAVRTVEYTRTYIRELVRTALANPCTYCGERLTINNISLDHKQAVSQGGTETSENLAPVCQPCQRRKGKLSAEEFMSLLECVATWAPASRKDLFTRLSLGGANLRAMWIGKNRGERAVKTQAPSLQTPQSDIFHQTLKGYKKKSKPMYVQNS